MYVVAVVVAVVGGGRTAWEAGGGAIVVSGCGCGPRVEGRGKVGRDVWVWAQVRGGPRWVAQGVPTSPRSSAVCRRGKRRPPCYTRVLRSPPAAATVREKRQRGKIKLVLQARPCYW